jgi:hypothetical protein
MVGGGRGEETPTTCVGLGGEVVWGGGVEFGVGGLSFVVCSGGGIRSRPVLLVAGVVRSSDPRALV